jgi:type I restriction enzyme S subunit
MEKLQPTLRFPEFEGDWVRIELKELSEKVNSGKTPLGGEAVYSSDGILFIRSQNVNNDRLELVNKTYIPSEINEGMKNSIVKSNDILLNITGASLGRSCVVPANFTIGNVNQHVCIIRLKNVANPRFIQPQFSSKKGQDLFQSLQVGGGREGLNFESIKKIKIALPSIDEQTKIATFLTSVDEKLNLLKEKKALLEEYKKGMMQQFFSQQLRFKDEDGNDFADWEEKCLGELANIKTGKLDANAMVLDGKYRFYTCAKEYYKIDNYAFDTEALLISGNGANVGYIHYYKGKFNAYQRTYVLDGFNENIHFIKYFLQQFLSKRILAEKNEGNTPYIVMSTLSEMVVAIPCLEEQTKIAIFLSAIDEKIELVAQQIEDTLEYKRGLLQGMFC